VNEKQPLKTTTTNPTTSPITSNNTREKHTRRFCSVKCSCTHHI